MNRQDSEKQFIQDIDNMLRRNYPVDGEQWSAEWTAEYRREMEIAHALAEADFSMESQMKHPLKRRLLDTYSRKEGHMNTPYSQRTVIRLVIVGALSILFLILVSPLGTTIAQSLVQIRNNWQLGEQTNVVKVDGDFVAEQNEDGDTIISPAPETASDLEPVGPDIAAETENQRHIVLDPIVSIEQAQEKVSFALLQPDFIPEGYEFQGVVVTNPGQASLEYTNVSAMQLMGLLQTAVDVNGPVQVTMSGDIMVENVEVNGVAALWSQAGEEGMLIWEANGINYQLVGLSDLDVALEVAKSIK